MLSCSFLDEAKFVAHPKGDAMPSAPTASTTENYLVRGVAAGDVSDCAGHRTRAIRRHQDRCIRHFSDPGQSLEQGSLRKTCLERAHLDMVPAFPAS